MKANGKKNGTSAEHVLPWLESQFAAKGLIVRFDYAGIKVSGRHVQVPVDLSIRDVARGAQAMVDVEEAWNELRSKSDDLRLWVVPATTNKIRGRRLRTVASAEPAKQPSTK